MGNSVVDGTYDLLVSTPIGDKRVKAVLTSEGEKLTADVKASGLPRVKGTGRMSGEAFAAEGFVKIPFVGSLDYRIEGTVRDDLLEAMCHTSRGDLHISGLRIG